MDLIKCSEENCDSYAFPLSEPPTCSFHIDNIDQWYEPLRDKCSSAGLDDITGMITMAVAKNIYRESLLRDPIGVELYKHFKKQVDPNDTYHFLFLDVVYFVLLAAASGTIGNAAYDAIKKALTKIHTKKYNLEEEFNKVVDLVKYEELRRLTHPDESPHIAIDIEIELKLRRKYYLLMDDENPDQ